MWNTKRKGSLVEDSVGRVITPIELEEFLRPSSGVLDIALGQIAQRPSSAFFCLPREVRTRILNYACIGLRVFFIHVNMVIGAIYRPPSTGDNNYLHGPREMGGIFEFLPRGPPAWMLLNKQMWSECLQQFHRYAEFFYTNRTNRPLLPHGKTPESHGIRFDHARIINLNNQRGGWTEIREEIDENGYRYYRVGLAPEKEAYLRQATYCLAQSSTIKDLTLNFRLRFYADGTLDPFVRDMRSGVAFLDQLPTGLHKVTIFILEGNHDLQANDPRARMFASVKEEMRRIVRKLISSPGEETQEARICYSHLREVQKCDCYKDDWRLMATSLVNRRARRMGKLEGLRT